ncbi:MAG TPA: sigma-70 family RNA polymerase sigma factor [Myxococcaceae bacterium]|jgi:RNA polymerase sigma-70 factor (ECF subfamily)
MAPPALLPNPPRPPDGSVVVRASTSADALGDAELVRRAVSGDSWAEEFLYRRYVRDIWNMVLRMVRCAADAEDVVQDTFATAFRELPRLRDAGALRSWLLRIAVRHVHRRLRRRRLRQLLGLEREDADEVSLESIAAEGVGAEARAELMMIDRILARVPSEQRIAWALRHVEGESLEDVARACDCSLATVKRRIAAVDERLRSHVQAREVSHD